MSSYLTALETLVSVLGLFAICILLSLSHNVQIAKNTGLKYVIVPCVSSFVRGGHLCYLHTLAKSDKVQNPYNEPVLASIPKTSTPVS